MMDESGKLVTDIEAIKHRLRNRRMKEGLEDMKEEKEKLAHKVMEAARINKTDPWDMADLEDCIKPPQEQKVKRSTWASE